MNWETQLVHQDTQNACDDPYAATAVPIYQTATFDIGDVDCPRPYDYARSGNPTRSVLERALADLEGGAHGFAFASGMAAIASLSRLLGPGDEVVLDHDVYGGTSRFFEKIAAVCQGIVVRRADLTNPDALGDVVNDRTRLVFVETPSNPLQHVVDIRAIASRLYGLGIVLVVDNTMMSPHLQQPLALGADVVVHSATKFLGGHGDVTAGALITRDDAIAERIGFVQNAEGSALGPFDSFLLLRGIKTLAIRMDRQQQVTREVVGALETRPEVRAIHWVGSPDHPHAALHARQARGAGSVFTIDVGDAARAEHLLAHTRLFQSAVSFGGIRSAISIPTCMSHASAVNHATDAVPLSPSLVRLSIGIEDPADLIADLNQAFDGLCETRSVDRRNADVPISEPDDRYSRPVSKRAICVGVGGH